MKHHKMKILYIQFKSFGDVIVSTVILRKLREKFPEAQIDYYTSSACADLLTGNPVLNIVYTERFPPASMEHYDMILRPYHCLQSSGGWHLSGKHFVELYAEACGVKINEIKPEFYNIAKVTQELQEQLKDTVLLQCNTNDSAKNWSMENWNILADLIKKAGLHPVQIGGKNDPAIVGISVLHNGSFSQTAGLMKYVLTTVCLDSAVQHLGAAIDASYIVLYGAKSSERVQSGLPMKKFQFAFNPDRNECQEACYLAICSKKKKCIDNITPEMIMKDIEYIRENKKVG